MSCAEVTLYQVGNGIKVKPKNINSIICRELVFNDKKDLIDFINDIFFDAEEAAQSEDEKQKKHTEK